jgi:hypothetical protein
MWAKVGCLILGLCNIPFIVTDPTRWINWASAIFCIGMALIIPPRNERNNNLKYLNFYTKWKKNRQLRQSQMERPEQIILRCPRCGRVSAIVDQGSCWDTAECIDKNCHVARN